jgi:hypothetical protein
METWNREELYAAIWEQPASKAAARYGISDVMLGKVCRKLSIPVPGRGYWARKAARQKLTKPPLPVQKKVPFMPRYKMPDANANAQPQPPPPEPTDSEYLRIKELESRTIEIGSIEKRHKMVIASEKRLSSGKPDRDQILLSRSEAPCLAIHVSANALGRALHIMNAIIVTLEDEGFPVSVGRGIHETSAIIFGHQIKFAIFEKLEVTGRREEGDGIRKTKVVDHAPTGNLELRMGDFTYGSKLRDRKKEKLENMLAGCVGGLMRLGRSEVLAAEEKRLREIEEARRREELWKLSDDVRKEEDRVKELEDWVTSWTHAKQIREFVAELEALWVSRGEDISSTSPHGQRSNWMRQQADRLDPLVESPPSVLDRKQELRRW